MINTISASDNVKFYLLIVTADFEIENTNIHDMLLKEIRNNRAIFNNERFFLC